MNRRVNALAEPQRRSLENFDRVTQS